MFHFYQCIFFKAQLISLSSHRETTYNIPAVLVTYLVGVFVLEIALGPTFPMPLLFLIPTDYEEFTTTRFKP